MSDINNPVTVVLWEAKAKRGGEAETKEFLTNAVTPSRHDVGCIDYDPR